MARNDLILASRYERLYNPAHFPAEKKRQLWEGIKRNQPALAGLMTGDPNIKALKQAFGAEVVFTKEELLELTQ